MKKSFEHKRGDRGAYRRYLDGMDSSMRQKVALVAAHLRAQGRVADMGMGSGTGSHALAALYPSIDVVGVDLDPMMVEIATERYQLPNLSFVVGDIATPVFEAKSLEAVLDSSVLHHVTTFSGYSHQAAAEALRVQSQQVAEHGVVIVRDFLAPEDQPVLLDLPTCEQSDASDLTTCSPAQLFERFAHEFRSLHPEPGFSYEKVGDVESTDDLGPPLRSGWRRYRVSLRMATEFVLRKDYRRDWVSEVKEEYCYFTQAEFEKVFGGLGLRVLASTPLRNPWIVNHRYKDKFDLWSETGEALEFPATNYLIVGEKVAPGLGVSFAEGPTCEPRGFLQLEHLEHKESGRVRDLVRRPHTTLDILPWFAVEGDYFIVARASYPRPLLRARCRQDHTLDGATAAGYVTEPLLVMQSDLGMGATVEACLAGAGIAPADLLSFAEGTSYYPSPGGIAELVESSLVEIEPSFVSQPLQNVSGFSSAGRVMAIEAHQLLRSAQVGGLLDARLELNVYELLLQKGEGVGPWIGEDLELPETSTPIQPCSFSEILGRSSRRAFRSTRRSGGFLELCCASFEESDAVGQVTHQAALEYVIPKTLSHNTLAVALLQQSAGVVYMAVADDDLPAAQSLSGNSELLVTPAWRMPKNIRTLTPALAWTRQKVEEDYGFQVSAHFELGGRYHPSLGVTPEAVHPFAFVVTNGVSSELHWVPIQQLIEQRGSLRDGHLRILALRAAHALGLLVRNQELGA